MLSKYKFFLNTLRDSKILPGRSFVEVSFFFVADSLGRLFTGRFIFSQAYMFKFLSESRWVSPRYFLDKIHFGDMVLYDYIIYAFNGKGFSRGTSFSQEESFGKCLGEVFERAPFNSVTFRGKVTKASIAELRKREVAFLDLLSLPQPLPSQKRVTKYLAYNDHTQFEWVAATSFVSEKRVLVPKQLVYWGAQEEVNMIRESNTNGLASATTKEEAVYSALSECLQRHYFFKAWYFPERELVVEVDIDDLSFRYKEVRKIRKECAVNMLNLRLFRIETELSPLFSLYFCILENKLTGGIYLGSSGSGESFSALYRSVQEALSIYTFTNRVILNGEGKSDYSGISVRDFKYGIEGNDRVIWWGHHITSEAKDVLNIFLGSKKEIFKANKFSSREVVNQTLGKFEDFYYSVAENDLLSKVGHFSARVILPKSYILTLSEHIATPLLEEMPSNTHMHPFP